MAVEAGTTPGVVNLGMTRGDTWTLTVTYQDSTGAAVDLSGASARFQIRISQDSSTTLLALASPGDITLNASGEIAVTASAAATAALDFSRAWYDLELTLVDGTVKTLIIGNIDLTKDVSRD